MTDKSSPSPLTRRDFLSTSAKLGAVIATAPYLARGAEIGAAKNADTVNVALIGCGVEGSILTNATRGIPGIRFVALCDIWPYNLTSSQRRLKAFGQDAQAFEDYKEMLATVKEFDAVIIAVPAEQAASLLGRVQLCFATAAESICSSPCWTAMVAFANPLRTNLRVVRHWGAIGWAARDGSKPGRGDQERWVVQAAPGWSSDHLECSAEEAAEQLLGLLQEALGESLPEPIHLSAHRWRYSRPNPTESLNALWDSAVNIGVCGDWLIAPRIESAWLSGQRLATLIG